MEKNDFCIILIFSENKYFKSGERIMDIYVENEQILENLDIFE